MSEKYAPIAEHLRELRKVIIWIAVALVLGTIICYSFFIEQAMALVTMPITDLGLDLKFISVAEGFMAHIKIALLGGVIIASPVICWQLMSFILPALYKHERRMFYMLLFFSVVLFVTGIVFAYYFVLRLALNALLFTFSGDLIPEITADYYISFVLKFLIPFGLVFEIPLFVYFLTKIGIIKPEFLRKNRKYVILVMLVMAAMLTPPDIISQLMLAAPMYLLYEISILISVKVYNRKIRKEAKQAQKEAKRQAKEEKKQAKRAAKMKNKQDDNATTDIENNEELDKKRDEKISEETI